MMGRILKSLLPSRTLGTYVAKLYLTRFFGVLIGLVAILQLLDLLNSSDDIMAADGAGADQILRYLSLRLPQLIAQFAPFTALLATLLTLAGLSQHSEIIIMKASGLSAQRILLPLGLACAGIAFAHLLFNELVVVKATSELEYWRDKDFAVNTGAAPTYTNRAWVTENGNRILVESVRIRSPGITVLDKVSVYQQDPDGRLTGMVRADFALFEKGRWTLYDVRHFDIATQNLTSTAREAWNTKIPPERFEAMAVKPERVNVFALARAIRMMRDAGESAENMVAAFWHKLASPFSSLLMPLLGAVAGFGIHRAGTLLARLGIGMGLGFTYFVADNFMLAMGQFGIAPPLVAAFAPLALFASLGFAVLIHTEE